MKYFNSKIVLFLAPIIIVFLLFRIYVVHQLSNPERFIIDEDITTLILGHSHTETALNDSLLTHTKNFSQGAESYFYTYVKLKKLIELNPNITTVYLSFANNQVEKFADKHVYDDKYIADKYKKYFFFLENPEKNVLLRSNFTAVVSAELDIAKNNLVNLIRNRGSLNQKIWWGQYHRLDVAKADSLARFHDNNVKYLSEHGVSEINLQYLQKIVTLCKEKNIALNFVRMPIHPVYSATFDEVGFQEIRTKYFDDIPFLDYMNFSLPSDCFGDLHHVNTKGAIVFSNYFNQEVLGHQTKNR